ncbi:MAG: hypothetical protein ACTSXJ_05675 [Candidatus Baldrarchaeia archaeon]
MGSNVHKKLLVGDIGSSADNLLSARLICQATQFLISGHSLTAVERAKAALRVAARYYGRLNNGIRTTINDLLLSTPQSPPYHKWSVEYVVKTIEVLRTIGAIDKKTSGVLFNMLSLVVSREQINELRSLVIRSSSPRKEESTSMSTAPPMGDIVALKSKAMELRAEVKRLKYEVTTEKRKLMSINGEIRGVKEKISRISNSMENVGEQVRDAGTVQYFQVAGVAFPDAEIVPIRLIIALSVLVSLLFIALLMLSGAA